MGVLPRGLGAAIGVAALVLLAGAGRAEERDSLTLGVGVFDVLKQEGTAATFSAEYRFGARALAQWFDDWFRGVGPLVGITGNTDGGVAGFADVFLDLHPLDDVVVWPSAGIVGYRQGDSIELGGVRQFHLEFAVAYEVAPRHLLGLSFQHISNGDTQESNRGVDSLLATYSIRFAPLF